MSVSTLGGSTTAWRASEILWLRICVFAFKVDSVCGSSFFWGGGVVHFGSLAIIRDPCTLGPSFSFLPRFREQGQ